MLHISKMTFRNALKILTHLDKYRSLEVAETRKRKKMYFFRPQHLYVPCHSEMQFFVAYQISGLVHSVLIRKVCRLWLYAYVYDDMYMIQYASNSMDSFLKYFQLIMQQIV